MGAIDLIASATLAASVSPLRPYSADPRAPWCPKTTRSGGQSVQGCCTELLYAESGPISPFRRLSETARFSYTCWGQPQHLGRAPRSPEGTLNQTTQPWYTGSKRKRVIAVCLGHRVYESRVD